MKVPYVFEGKDNPSAQVVEQLLLKIEDFKQVEKVFLKEKDRIEAELSRQLWNKIISKERTDSINKFLAIKVREENASNAETLPILDQICAQLSEAILKFYDDDTEKEDAATTNQGLVWYQCSAKALVKALPKVENVGRFDEFMKELNSFLNSFKIEIVFQYNWNRVISNSENDGPILFTISTFPKPIG